MIAALWFAAGGREVADMAVDERGRAAVGARLRAARVARGLTVREVAAGLGVSVGTWSALENGRTGADKARLEAAATLLAVDPSELLPEQANPAPEPGSWREFPELELPAPLYGALLAFVELGYHGATVRDIARWAGMSVAGVYHHWPSKQHLLVALLDTTMDDLFDRCSRAPAEADGPVDRLHQLVEALALFHTYRRELAFIGASEMRSLEEPDRTRIASLRTQIQRMVDEEVLEGARRGLFGVARPREAARAVVTLCTALPQWWTPNGPSTPEQTAEQYVEFALDLVRCRA
jgi:AcrR family transcriptional regulator/DNA-binding XRE family transcriptional regulator